MITEATIKQVKYFPEQLPGAIVTDIAAGSETPILDLRGLAEERWVGLSEIAVDRDDDVEMRFKVDKDTRSSLAGSMFDGLANNFFLLARQNISYNLFNKAVGGKTNYKSFFSLWVIKPTVADKLCVGIHPRALLENEQKLNTELKISDEVEKGVLPWPLLFQIPRKYQVLQEETHSFNVTVPTAGVTVETVPVVKGKEFLVLTKLSANPGTAAGDNIRIAIDRDRDIDYVEFPTWALGTTPGVALEKGISCFIPALDELRIKLKATTQRDINIRFTVRKCALTNIHRVKWRLVEKGELPAKQQEAYDKIVAGIY